LDNTKIAVITGATSGFGAEFAKNFAKLGYNLLITGRRKNEIGKIANQLRQQYKVDIEIIIADFSIESEFNKLLQRINNIEKIEILVNNAGFGHIKNFFEDDYKRQEKMVQVHINAMLQLTHMVVPKMIKNNKGYILNVSSVAAFLASPRHELYCSTKAFINTYSESIAMTLRDKNIKVQSLCPGLTHTDFHQKLNWNAENLKSRGLIRWMTSDYVIKKSIKAMNKKAVLVIPGLIYKLLYLFIKIMPRRAYYLLAIKSRDKFR
jgi:short-subunit dehydrogenase